MGQIDVQKIYLIEQCTKNPPKETTSQKCKYEYTKNVIP